jgi:hypothetical protein
VSTIRTAQVAKLWKEQCLKAHLNKMPEGAPEQAGWSSRGLTAPPPEGGGKQRLTVRRVAQCCFLKEILTTKNRAKNLCFWNGLKLKDLQFIIGFWGLKLELKEAALGGWHR